jgi:uncharacterized membrane protein
MNNYDLFAIFLILCAGIITYLLRFGGLMIGDILSKHSFIENLIKALPGTILVSFVVPSILVEGYPGILSAIPTAIVAKKTNNIFVALIVGLSIIIAFRNFL